MGTQGGQRNISDLVFGLRVRALCRRLRVSPSAGRAVRLPALVIGVVLAFAVVAVPMTDGRAAHAQSGGLQAANVALVRARTAERAAFFVLLTEREQSDRARFFNAVARNDRNAAMARLARSRAQTSLEDRRMRAVVLDSYVAGGTVDTLASVLTSGSATAGPGLGRLYTAVAQAEAMSRLQQALEVEEISRSRRDEAQRLADEAARALTEQLDAELRAEGSLATASEQARLRTAEQDRAMAGVWGGVGGSWRCDGGGRPGTVDTIGSLVAARQGGQGFDSSRFAQLLPPLPGALPGSPFGWRQDPIEPDKVAWHEGVDISAPAGTPVFAVAEGVVVIAGEADDGYGIKVVIDHGGGLSSVYAHLSSVQTGVGQSVAAGQPIGAVGSTGRSTGAHLHFELRTYGAQCDPMWGWGAG